MSLFEYYRMNIPLFVPSLSLLKVGSDGVKSSREVVAVAARRHARSRRGGVEYRGRVARRRGGGTRRVPSASLSSLFEEKSLSPPSPSDSGKRFPIRCHTLAVSFL